MNNLNEWNVKNKLNKKSINSIWSSLNNTKNINKTKSKSTSKSNSKSKSKNKNSYGKLLTENIKSYKININNNRIGAIEKEKTYKINNLGKQNADKKNKNLSKNINNTSKNLNKNNNNISNFNSFQKMFEKNNINDSQINLNKKRGINLVFKGTKENKIHNKAKINNILYNINRNNKNNFSNIINNSNTSNLT